MTDFKAIDLTGRSREDLLIIAERACATLVGFANNLMTEEDDVADIEEEFGLGFGEVVEMAHDNMIVKARFVLDGIVAEFPEEGGMTDSRQFHEDFRRGTPRSLRAVRFANAMLSIMRDYLPSEGDILRLIHERLCEAGYQQNFEIINVPPEKDALDKLQLEHAMIETHPMIIKAEQFLAAVGKNDA